MEFPEGFPIRIPTEALASPYRPEEEGLPEPISSGVLNNPVTLSGEASSQIRAEVARAGGRKVSFLAEIDEQGVVRNPRAVARGSSEAVLAAATEVGPGGIVVHSRPDGVFEALETEIETANLLYEQGLGTATVNNSGEELDVLREPPEIQEVRGLRSEELDAILAPGGLLAERHLSYEDRPGQREMVHDIVSVYNEGGVAILEAGTGTGKSLAYLLPAARWAQENKKRTVVSTNTINLQEQLASKDLPLVSDLIGDFRWALVKGRGNYVSIRRALLAAESQSGLFEEDRSSEIREILSWIEDTQDGSRSDLQFVPSDDTWDEVKSDADICLHSRCPHFQECFFQRSRRRAASADLLVVNHHLLFTDLAVRRGTRNYTQSAVLPAYQHVILDEAHNIEDAATSHLGVEVTRRGLHRSMARLDHRGRGILTAVHDGVEDVMEAPGLRERIENRVRPVLSRARSGVDDLIDRLEPFVSGRLGAVRLGPSGIGEPVNDFEVREALGRAVLVLEELVREIAEFRARLELVDESAQRFEGRVMDLRSIERRVSAAIQGLNLVLAPGEEGDTYVRWLENRGQGRYVNLMFGAAPTELGAMLHESLFTQVDSSVLTSATLSTRNSFDFIRSRLGLGTAELSGADKKLEVIERIILSEFNFEDQALLAVPTDLPAAERGDPEFQKATADVVVELAELSRGGLFVLFTSHASLNHVAELLRARDLEEDWPLFVQGEGDRSQLLERFINSGSGVLLGTASFWEGVDVPGEPLRGLVIQKLPFRVPTEPITAARMEMIEEMGGDPFQQFMLPHAALRLKQGFGRLIRSQTDQGVVVILDDRLVTKRYGRYLRESLPQVPTVKGAWSDLRHHLASFYKPVEPGPMALGTRGAAR